MIKLKVALVNDDVIFLELLTHDHLPQVDSILKFEGKVFFNQEEIERIKLIPENCWLIKLMQGDNLPVGMIWLSKELISNEEETSITVVVSPLHKRKGFAEKAVKIITEYAFSILKVDTIVAIIHRLNHQSLNLFKRIGYSYIVPDEERAGWCFDVYKIRKTSS